MGLAHCNINDTMNDVQTTQAVSSFLNGLFCEMPNGRENEGRIYREKYVIFL